MPTLLVLERKKSLTSLLREAFSAQEYNIVQIPPDKSAIESISADSPVLIILDVNPHQEKGRELFRQIRLSCAVPLIVVSKQNSRHGCASALELGAEDCLIQPLDEKEFLARVGAHLRQSNHDEDLPMFATAEISIDFARRRLTARGRQTHLPPKQFHILKYLVSNRGKPVPSHVLCELVWGAASIEHTENLRVLISQLRKLIESDPEHPKHILTKPRVGYIFEAPSVNPVAHAKNDTAERLKSRKIG